jgi:predicted PurR-regulated permease PerM
VDAARIQARAVVKVAAISLAVIAASVVAAIVVLQIRTEIRWVFAALFLALAMNPAVDRVESLRLRGHRVFPRWLAILAVYVLFVVLFAFLVLQVIPPIVREFEHLGSKVPGYVEDFRRWASQSQQFQDLNHKYDLTRTLNEQASTIPSRLGDAATHLQSVTVSVLEHLLAAITILALTFFLLLDGRQQGERLLGRMQPATAARCRRIATRVAGVVKSYVSVNLLLAISAGLFTWLALELLGVDLAVTMAVIVGFLDLVPLIGFTVGGFFVAIVAAFHDFPTALIVWLVLFLVYQQVQDRVIQPLLYKNAVRVHPAVAIFAILVGGQLAGILGALLAIPTAATIGVLIDEGLRWRREAESGEVPEEGRGGVVAQPGSAAD